MRHYQRGIATVIILIFFLIAGVAIASGAFVFYQNERSSSSNKKAASINSFEDCAKLYPVMESYPEQCNTPDGKHFTRELSEEEKQRLVPPTTPQPSAMPDYCKNITAGQSVKDCGDFMVVMGPCCDQQDIILDKNGNEIAKCGGIAGYIGDCKKYLPQTQCSEMQCSEDDETSNWKLYTNNKMGYSIKYPADQFVVCGESNSDFYLDEGTSQDVCTAGEGAAFIGITDKLEGTGDIKTSSVPECYSIYKESITLAGAPAVKYSKIIKKDTGNCQMSSAYGRNEKHIIIDNPITLNIFYNVAQDEVLKNKIISTFEFIN